MDNKALTVIGLLLTGAIGGGSYYQAYKATKISGVQETNRLSISKEQETNRLTIEDQRLDAQYFRDTQINLLSEFTQADDLGKLNRLAISLQWLKKKSTFDDVLELVNEFDKKVLAEIKRLQNIGTDDQLDQTKAINIASTIKMLEVSVANRVKEKSDKKISDAAIKLYTLSPQFISNKKKIQLTSIQCLDPQSNWPKKCDTIYLSINGKKLLLNNLEICRGQTKKLANVFIKESDLTKVQLSEVDKIKNDDLGKFILGEQGKKSDVATLEGSSKKGRWQYILNFKRL